MRALAKNQTSHLRVKIIHWNVGEKGVGMCYDGYSYLF